MAGSALALAIIALALATVALSLSLISYREQRTARTAPATRAPRVAPLLNEDAQREAAEHATGPAAFVINPIKVADVAALEEAARTISRELGMPDPLIFHTSVEDPGGGQTRAAVAAGASVVVAAGGDGTVRAVATELAGGQVPMALIPSGTGNLLARNLDLPIDGHNPLVQTALSGRDMPIDLGWITAIGPDSPPGTADEHVFLVMSGTGFDAQMVAGAGDALKKRVGWVAYFFAGVRHLHSRKTRLTMQIGHGAWHSYRVRTLLFANCGRLPAGIILLPDAELDDGFLDIAAIDTRGGLWGWIALLWRVLLQGLGFRRQMPYDAASIEFSRGRVVSVNLDQPQPVQVDGDIIGVADELHVRVQESGLRVRVRR